MVRTNQFERVYRRWKERKVTQQEAAAQLEMSERKFRRYVERYRDEGVEGLLDRRLDRRSPRRAPEEEVEAVVALYVDRYSRRNIRHFYEAYVEEHGGVRSYSWVKERQRFPLCFKIKGFRGFAS
ncbi:MAG: helix-turn-helix domain-containing protein [Gemmatimonadota bacterium]|nr:helix-turn-helix domain-containing protein [Gemmatimonadota bacterium]